MALRLPDRCKHPAKTRRKTFQMDPDGCTCPLTDRCNSTANMACFDGGPDKKGVLKIGCRHYDIVRMRGNWRQKMICEACGKTLNDAILSAAEVPAQVIAEVTIPQERSKKVKP